MNITLPTQHGNPYGDMSEQEDEASSVDSNNAPLVALAMLLLVHYIYKH